jgi:hypothetical protein
VYVLSSQEKVETLECVRIEAERGKVQRIEPHLKAEFLLLQSQVLVGSSAQRCPKSGVPPWRVIVFLRIPPVFDRCLRSPWQRGVRVVRFNICDRSRQLWVLLLLWFVRDRRVPRKYGLKIDKGKFIAVAAN